MIETFQTTVKHRINGDKNHGWGLEDSLAVAEACIAKATGKPASDELKLALREIINPSQFRQKLAKQGLLNEETKKQRTENLFSKFNA